MPARIFLRDMLEPEHHGTFRFLDLPPELRNVIYEMVLVFDKGGLAVSHGIHGTSLRLSCRETERYFADDGARLARTTNLVQVTAPPLENMLALLPTCRQVYTEAMPYFYRDNQFRFENQDHFADAMYWLSDYRRKHLSKLYLDFRSSHSAGAPFLRRILEGMSADQRLRRLEIVFGHDDDWLKMRARQRRGMGIEQKSTFTKVQQIPIMPSLALFASCAEDLVITGHCPKIRTYIRAEVARSREAEMARLAQMEAASAPGKRKRTSGKVGGSVKAVEPARKRTKRQEAIAANAEAEL
ncbi:hypothetical protein B0A55_05913 [Friedmanniomyces simplex]|uniref:DUF7730 domain-containing protein n=1 Tax=Friedmanniomyces simplex TaxID=329884 RepID=A0A4U0XFN7_9PEZI|nr:hypothetical protein B0A55_05913 [Friedmanniomyces simplex]